MNETQRIADQFERLQKGDCWVGMNMEKALEGITPEIAVKNYNGSNTIWQLVNHITYWRKTVMLRLKGIDTPPDMPDMLQPAIINEENWKATLEQFQLAYAELMKAILMFDDTLLLVPSPKKKQTYADLLLGCLQHDAYHMGQIIILKKQAVGI